VGKPPVHNEQEASWTSEAVTGSVDENIRCLCQESSVVETHSQ
jgi:hypothetical protein